MERVDANLRVRQLLGDRPLECRRRVDRHHPDPVPPACAALTQPAADSGGVATVHDPEDLTAVGVDNGRHPRLDPPPATTIWVAEPADPTVAVLIDTKATHVQLIHIRQQHRGRVDSGLHGPPRHTMVRGHLRDRPTGIDHCGQQRRPQPGGAAGPDR
jgi:hypothetical protein